MLTRYVGDVSPFQIGGFGDLYETINQFFKEPFFGPAFYGDAFPTYTFSEKENENGEKIGYVLELAVAGYKKSDIEITLDEEKRLLKFSGKRTENKSKSKLISKNTKTSSWIKSFLVPEDADLNLISSSMEDGILTIDFGLRDKAFNKSVRTIEISDVKQITG